MDNNPKTGVTSSEFFRDVLSENWTGVPGLLWAFAWS